MSGSSGVSDFAAVNAAIEPSQFASCCCAMPSCTSTAAPSNSRPLARDGSFSERRDDLDDLLVFESIEQHRDERAQAGDVGRIDRR